MDESKTSAELMKEVKVAKQAVERAIRVYGPPNINSILDKDTYVDKLGSISAKLDAYFEKSDEVVETLEGLKGSEFETDIQKTIDEIEETSQALINKVTKMRQR